MSGVWAVVPVKEFEGAKQRLSPCLSPDERRLLATTMFEDVLEAVSAVEALAGVLVVTIDPVATSLASRHGARVVWKARGMATLAPSRPPRACSCARVGQG